MTFHSGNRSTSASFGRHLYRLMCLVHATAMIVGQSALAATITVTTTADNRIAGDGSCTLREALVNASQGDGAELSGGDCTAAGLSDEIIFHSSLAGGTVELNGSDLSYSPEGSLEPQPLTIAGPVPGDASGMTLDANYQSRILEIRRGHHRPKLTLRNLKLTHGRALAGGPGGAALVTGDLELYDMALVDNQTVPDHACGGAIFAWTTYVERSEISNNRTSGERSGGGAICTGELTLIDSRITDNWTNGKSSEGGGIHASGATVIGTAIMENRTLGPQSGGGGVFLTAGATFENSVIANNSTLGDSSGGGGVAAAGNLDFLNTTIAENSTSGPDSDGGGIRVTGSSGFSPFFHAGNSTFINSTVSGNTAIGASSSGGAIAFGVSEAGRQTITGGDLDALFATFADNMAAEGAHIFYSRSTDNQITIESSIVASTAGPVCNRNADAIRNSLVTDSSCGGSLTSPSEIGLGALNDYGGPTPTHSLMPGSAALDAAGDCTAEHGIASDQRGISRPIGPACDIGAVEGTGPQAMPSGGWPGWLALLISIAGLGAWRQRLQA